MYSLNTESLPVSTLKTYEKSDDERTDERNRK